MIFTLLHTRRGEEFAVAVGERLLRLWRWAAGTLTQVNVLERYEGKAVIVGGVARFDVRCEWEVVQDEIPAPHADDLDASVPGMKHWSGRFQVVNGMPALDTSHPYQLELPDGRTATIHIKELDYADATEMGSAWRHVLPTAAGSFIGSGPSPQ